MKRQPDRFFQDVIIGIILFVLLVYTAFDIFFAFKYMGTPISDIPYFVYKFFLVG